MRRADTDCVAHVEVASVASAVGLSRCRRNVGSRHQAPDLRLTPHLDVCDARVLELARRVPGDERAS